MEPAEHWRRVYEAKQPDEVSWFQQSPVPSIHALVAISAVPTMSVVDVGAGASTLVDDLLAADYKDITLVELAAPALEAVRARLGTSAEGVHWEVADIRGWRPGRTFDIWHDRAAFHFLTEEADRAAYRRALLDGTHLGSHVIIATFAPDGPEKCSGLPVCRYDASGLAAALGPEFKGVADWLERHITPWSSVQHFQWAIFRRE